LSGTSPEERRKARPWYRWDGGWYEADGDRTRYCVWPLDGESVVFDVGGYEGAWSKRIAEQYGATVHLFEPAPRAIKMAREKLAGLPTVHFHPYGLGATDATAPLGDSDRDGASFCKPGVAPWVMAQKRCLSSVLQELGVAHIDLMAINVEGGEYELLGHILDEQLIGQVERLMIQWHAPTVIESEAQLKLQDRIARTHAMVWNHAAWEAWERKTDDGK